MSRSNFEIGKLEPHRNVQVFGCTLLPENEFPLQLKLPTFSEELKDKDEVPLTLTEITPEKPLELVEMKPKRKSNFLDNRSGFF